MTTMTVNQQGLADQVRQAIEEMILTGELEPGHRLHQASLADRFGVSRTVILKALHRMESDMLIESKPRRGLYVRKFDLQEVYEFFECRIGIESVAVRLAARKITDVQVDELRELFRPFEEDSEHFDDQEYGRADRALHNRILEISGNCLLKRFTIIGNLLVLAGKELWYPPQEGLASHIEIIDALERRDEEAAVAAMRKHLEENLKHFNEHLNSNHTAEQ